MANLTPAIFFGHGNPMNALLKNAYTEGWASIGTSIPRPKAVLSVSAHWYIPASAVTDNLAPRTLHDFGGFPKELYRVQYPAAGSPELARHVQDLAAPLSVAPDDSWGLDHGTWAVLRHVFPDADVPIVQLSIDERQPPRFHYELGRHLAPLRKEGVLVIGSGNIVHNLHTYAWGNQKTHPFDWAVRFEKQARELMLKGDDTLLIDYEKLGRDAMLSIPTPDHYLPLLYVLGLRGKGEQVSFPVEGVDGGSVSMLAVRIG
ncbi:MAG TPA: 4,5-DOPA dioxygenase extradiol [Syntrophales bacterium]|nr:4,5-DOPA dioxygenase extradiol [Syntrophales bacterium]